MCKQSLVRPLYVFSGQNAEPCGSDTKKKKQTKVALLAVNYVNRIRQSNARWLKELIIKPISLQFSRSGWRRRHALLIQSPSAMILRLLFVSQRLSISSRTHSSNRGLFMSVYECKWATDCSRSARVERSIALRMHAWILLHRRAALFTSQAIIAHRTVLGADRLKINPKIVTFNNNQHCALDLFWNVIRFKRILWRKHVCCADSSRSLSVKYSLFVDLYAVTNLRRFKDEHRKGVSATFWYVSGSISEAISLRNCQRKAIVTEFETRKLTNLLCSFRRLGPVCLPMEGGATWK